MHKGNTGTQSHMGRTVLMTHYGQHVVEDLVNGIVAPCTVEYINIPVEKVGCYLLLVLLLLEITIALNYSRGIPIIRTTRYTARIILKASSH